MHSVELIYPQGIPVQNRFPRRKSLQGTSDLESGLRGHLIPYKISDEKISCYCPVKFRFYPSLYMYLPLGGNRLNPYFVITYIDRYMVHKCKCINIFNRLPFWSWEWWRIQQQLCSCTKMANYWNILQYIPFSSTSYNRKIRKVLFPIFTKKKYFKIAFNFRNTLKVIGRATDVFLLPTICYYMHIFCINIALLKVVSSQI